MAEHRHGSFVDEAGRLFHFFSAQELETELSWLDMQEIKVLENIHPQRGRKSSLFVVMAQFFRRARKSNSSNPLARPIGF